MLARTLTVARLTASRAAPVARYSTVMPRLAATAAPFRSFSCSTNVLSAGRTDKDLAAKIQQELQWENDADSTAEPNWLAEFKKDGPFQIEDIPGSDEIALTRTFGNESIRIVFSIADVEDKQLQEFDEEPAVESADGAAAESEEVDAPSTDGVRTAIIITKEGAGGMTIDAIADESGFQIDNVSYYDSADLASSSDMQADWKRRSLYIGPTFENLDEELQDSFVDFLDERGIGQALGTVVADLAEFKEQKEYVSWLEKVKNFIKH